MILPAQVSKLFAGLGLGCKMVQGYVAARAQKWWVSKSFGSFQIARWNVSIHRFFLWVYQGTGHTKETTYIVLQFKDYTGLCFKVCICKKRKNVNYLENATFPRLFKRTQALTPFDNFFPITESIELFQVNNEEFSALLSFRNLQTWGFFLLLVHFDSPL